MNAFQAFDQRFFGQMFSPHLEFRRFRSEKATYPHTPDGGWWSWEPRNHWK